MEEVREDDGVFHITTVLRVIIGEGVIPQIRTGIDPELDLLKHMTGVRFIGEGYRVQLREECRNDLLRQFPELASVPNPEPSEDWEKWWKGQTERNQSLRGYCRGYCRHEITVAPIPLS